MRYCLLCAALLPVLALAPGSARAAAWVQLQPPSGSPPARMAHTAVYDPVRHRVLVFGGLDLDGRKNDVWTLDLLPGIEWVQLSPAGTPPAPRSDHAAAYDPVGDRMLVFGGDNGSAPLNDVWALSLSGLPEWLALSPAGPVPAARLSHTAAFDAAALRLLVHGGHDGVMLRDDVWALSFAGPPVWSEMLPALPPSARRDAAAVFDPVRSRLFLHGGYDGVGFLADAWSLDESGAPAWQMIAPAGSTPTGKITHAGTYDSRRDRFIQFGGSYGSETWALSLAGPIEWEQIVPDGTPPPGRIDHTLTYVPAGDRLIVFGGHTGLATLGDTWSLPLDDATAVAAAPALRSLRVWPNPAGDRAHFHFGNDHDGDDRTLTVHDVRGRIVQRFRVTSPDLAWDLRDAGGRPVPSGVYFCALEEHGRRVLERLIVIR